MTPSQILRRARELLHPKKCADPHTAIADAARLARIDLEAAIAKAHHMVGLASEDRLDRAIAAAEKDEQSEVRP